jgi:1-acyl-sn-glycerol-3-phosphate acyltransferase
MVAFCLLSLLLPLSSVASFQFSNLAKIKGGQLYHLKHQRLTSVLFASIQEERKQPISNGKKIADNVNHHNHNNHHHQHHQTSPLVIIQDKESQVKTHHTQLLHQTRHTDQLHIQHQTPTLLDLKDSDHHAHTSILSEISNQAPSSQQPQQQEKSYVLSMEEISPIFQWTNSKGKTKVLNLYGVYNILVIAATLPFWLLSMEILQRLGDAIEGFDDNRAKFDYSGKIWCRTFLRLVDSYPEIAGDVSRLKDKKEGGYGGACLFVANHASFLDIAVLCTVLDPVFKFIAKDSLVKFPGVGKQLVGVS